MTRMGAPTAETRIPAPVFVHGSGGDRRVWSAQSTRFDRAATIDLPGHPVGAPFDDAAALADLLGDALERAGGRWVPIGHSLGGALALMVARRRPELVDGVVVIASGARLPVPDRVFAHLASDPRAERRRLLDGFLTPDSAARAWIRATLDDCPDASLLADYRACRSVDLRPDLAAIDHPVLVICTRDDPFIPPRYARELVDGLPRAELALIAGARHMPMVDAPRQVNRLIGAFLARIELDG